ncbi:hypothetical protein Pyn_16937 [Prunus yedoensis var. nudiflora]|uniref:Uncharacterized protein n=1 Tax=Prunus yedoensis var. nudiflora TaxID=2094558 RepID=A0A314UWH0_PRUYE|nr:hypothetical protein Pyn_16937 [Prunus yedoensis var. nudiflora]
MSIPSDEFDEDYISSSRSTEYGEKDSPSSPTVGMKDPAIDSPPDSTGSIRSWESPLFRCLLLADEAPYLEKKA